MVTGVTAATVKGRVARCRAVAPGTYKNITIELDDVVLVDAGEWDDAVLGADRFTGAFLARYPWRALGWVCHDAGRAHWLGESLQEFKA